jgi:hypothetical protein
MPGSGEHVRKLSGSIKWKGFLDRVNDHITFLNADISRGFVS